jgi:hypothetical protein
VASTIVKNPALRDLSDVLSCTSSYPPILLRPDTCSSSDSDSATTLGFNFFKEELGLLRKPGSFFFRRGSGEFETLPSLLEERLEFNLFNPFVEACLLLVPLIIVKEICMI